MRVVFYKRDRACLFFIGNKAHKAFVNNKVDAEAFTEIGNLFYKIAGDECSGGIVRIADKDCIYGTCSFYICKKIFRESEIVIAS